MNVRAVMRRSIFISLAIGLICAGILDVSDRAAAASNAKDDTGAPRFALLVGITNYKSPSLNKIDGCENNVPLLARTLIDQYGFKEANVVTLLNDKATKAGIIDTFRSHLIGNARKAKPAGKEAVVVYYFCGHGSQYPDQDKDENDGLDETFVTYDSRTGDTPDMLDDELDDLKAELRPFTSNTTLILESCHSGTGSRGDDGDTQYISEEADIDKKVHPPYKRKFPPTTDDDSATYTEIAASASTNTAKSESGDHCDCDKPYSLMTKAMVEALNRANDRTTYRSLMREVEYAVAENSRQEPQLEGNRDITLFNGAARRNRPYIEVESVSKDGSIVIKAGRSAGLKIGSQVAIYSSASETNTGDTDWLANGTVKDVRDFRAVVQLPPANDAPNVSKVDIKSHVVLTSPVFGGGPLLVDLAGANPTKSAGDAVIAAEIERRLKDERLLENQLVSIVTPGAKAVTLAKNARGIVRLRKGKFGDAFPTRIRDLARVPKPSACTVDSGTVVPEPVPAIKADTEVYYLDDGNIGGTPLFGKVFLPGENAAADIAKAIRNYAFRTNLESLDNDASTLPANVSVTVEKITGIELVESCRNGRLALGPKAPPKSSDIQPAASGKVPYGSIFRFRVKNISGELAKKRDPFAGGERLYVTAIFLRNNGDIDVIYSGKGAKDPIADGIEKTFGGYVATKPGGTERLIVIVSKSYVDLSFYDTGGATRNNPSALERILKQSGQKTRDSGTMVPDEPDGWGVLRQDIEFVD